MIQSFRDADAHQLFEARSNKRWAAIKDIALRKLDQIEASINLIDLRVPPGNQYEVVVQCKSFSDAAQPVNAANGLDEESLVFHMAPAPGRKK